MKLTPEQRYRILNELKPENKEGILSRLIEDIHRTFHGVRTGQIENSRPYALNVEQLRELTKDIGKFDRDAYDIHSFWIDPDGCCGELLDEYKLYEEEEECYFDFDRDVASIRETIMTRAETAAPGTLYIKLYMVYGDLIGQAKRFMELHLGVMPGWYYYHKDHYGTEKCYYVGIYPEVQNDQENTLYMLTESFPVQIITKGDWNNMKRDDEDNQFVKARNHTIKQALEDGDEFPFMLVTHIGDDLSKKYEVVYAVDYEELIHEYAGPHDFRIEPTYIRGIDITREQAIERGMYALAKEIEMYELKQEDEDEQRSFD